MLGAVPALYITIASTIGRSPRARAADAAVLARRRPARRAARGVDVRRVLARRAARRARRRRLRRGRARSAHPARASSSRRSACWRSRARSASRCSRCCRTRSISAARAWCCACGSPSCCSSPPIAAGTIAALVSGFAFGRRHDRRHAHGARRIRAAARIRGLAPRGPRRQPRSRVSAGYVPSSQPRTRAVSSVRLRELVLRRSCLRWNVAVELEIDSDSPISVLDEPRSTSLRTWPSRRLRP